MIELSKRMKMNADLVPQGCSLADIGCDHGYVSIYLARQKRCQKIVAMDVKQGPLTIAKRNIERANLQQEITCRLSDGLTALAPKEVDAVLIAGMGGMLICHILQAKPEVLEGIHTMVLQAQSDWAALRRTIWDLGFSIEEEQACVDAGKYYFAIRAVRGAEHMPYTEEEITYGRLLPQERNKLYLRWLQKEKEKKQEVLFRLQKNETESAQKRMAELRRELDCIQWIVANYYGG